jgi:hypothetical protein
MTIPDELVITEALYLSYQGQGDSHWNCALLIHKMNFFLHLYQFMVITSLMLYDTVIESFLSLPIVIK